MTNSKLTDEQLQEIYGEAVSCEVAEKNGVYMASFDLLCKMDDVGGTAYTVRKLIDMLRAERAELQERRKADSELVSHRYKLDQSGDVTSELTELRIRRWKMQALRDAHNPESTQQVKLYACAMYEACEWIQERFRDDELSKKS